jgi:hypothetical protein
MVVPLGNKPSFLPGLQPGVADLLSPYGPWPAVPAKWALPEIPSNPAPSFPPHRNSPPPCLPQRWAISLSLVIGQPVAARRHRVPLLAVALICLQVPCAAADAFDQAVQNSVGRVLKRENPGVVADEDHGTWYRELFAASVTAGLLKPADLAGYRNSQVYIRKSMHVPLNSDAVRDAMPVFFELLREDAHPAVRVVLGHFVFVYIHPYMDGNGRVGRFLMNLILASGGYPWTVIPVEERKIYMEALEKASVGEDIVPFAAFLAGLVKKGLAGEPLPAVPKVSS